MYWYYKYPLIALSALALLGLCWKVIGTDPQDPPPQAASGTAPVQVSPAPAAPALPTPSAEPPPTATPLPAPAAGPSASALLLAQALEKRQQGFNDLAEDLAQQALQAAAKDLADPDYAAAAELIGAINIHLASSSAPSSRKLQIKVEPGMALSSLASGKTTVAAIQRANDLDLSSAVIHPGQILAFFGGPWSIHVVKSTFTLELRHQDRLFKLYRIGIGRDNRTPVGSFVIYGKKVDPDWEKSPTEIIKAGDPRNCLGSRWMALCTNPDLARTGFGIHGTIFPESIGTASSLGCIRLKNSDVEELYDLLPDASVKVNIQD